MWINDLFNGRLRILVGNASMVFGSIGIYGHFFQLQHSLQKYYGKITSYIEIQGQLSGMLAGAGAAFLLEGTTGTGIDLFGVHLQLPFQIQAWEIHEIFLLDAATYFVAFIIIYFLKYVSLVERHPDSGSPFQQLKIGYRFLMDHPMVFLFGVASYSIFVAVMLEGFYLGANYVNEHLMAGGNVYATSDLFYALGAVFAGIAIRSVFKKTTLPASIILMTFITTGLFAVLAFSKSISVFFAMLFILGICNAGTRIQRTTFLFLNIPNQVYGRAASVFFLSNISIYTIYFFQHKANFFSVNSQKIYLACKNRNHGTYLFVIRFFCIFSAFRCFWS